MRRLLYVLTVLLLLVSPCVHAQVEIGKPLPAWEEGELDIHFINTGRGECTWQIMPDGTTFLVDASGSLLKVGVKKKSDPLPARPSADITAGKVIVDYINHFSPAISKGHVNYFLLTHFHGDHMGNVNKTVPMHESGQFQLSSLPEIGTNLIFDKMMDRDYPDYTYPVPSRLEKKLIYNYKAFLNWTATANGTEIEQWKVGSRTQVTPVYNPDCGVSIRAYSGNGYFWTGEGEETYTLMPTTEEYEAGDPEAIPSENCFCCSYILTFGDFDFFLGGDLQHNDREIYEYKDVETPIAKVAHKVEVMKADHHGTNSTQDPYLMSVLCPDVWVASNWKTIQPRPLTVDWVLEANPDCAIFTTNMPKENIPDLGEGRLAKIVSKYGHVVVRVNPDGKSFMVYTLEDGDQLYNVKSTHGPYQCTK